MNIQVNKNRNNTDKLVNIMVSSAYSFRHTHRHAKNTHKNNTPQTNTLTNHTHNQNTHTHTHTLTHAPAHMGNDPILITMWNGNKGVLVLTSQSQLKFPLQKFTPAEATGRMTNTSRPASRTLSTSVCGSQTSTTCSLSRCATTETAQS